MKGLNKVKLGREASFKDLCIDCIEILKGESSFVRSGKVVKIKDYYPLICEAYGKLGPERMKALAYRKKLIEEALLVSSNLNSLSCKTAKLLDLKRGQTYSRKEIKLALEKIYLKLGINKKAKATDLRTYYDYKSRFKRGDKGMVSGFVVLGCNFKVTR